MLKMVETRTIQPDLNIYVLPTPFASCFRTVQDMYAVSTTHVLRYRFTFHSRLGPFKNELIR